jgi:hypothetical protein
MEEPPSFQRLSQKPESIPFPGSRLYDVGNSKNESTRWLSWIKCDTELGRPAKANEGEYQRDRTTHRASGRGRQTTRPLLLREPQLHEIPGTHPLQPSRRLVASLMHALIDLPEQIVGQTEIPEHRSLAARNLQRGAALGLASGEAVAREMGVEPLSAAEPGWRPVLPSAAPGRIPMVDLHFLAGVPTGTV